MEISLNDWEEEVLTQISAGHTGSPEIVTISPRQRCVSRPMAKGFGDWSYNA